MAFNPAGRHPGTVAILKWFTSGHLPDRLKAVAEPCQALAEQMAETLPDGPELTAGLRKLLEAKDCAELDRTGERVSAKDG